MLWNFRATKWYLEQQGHSHQTISRWLTKTRAWLPALTLAPSTDPLFHKGGCPTTLIFPLPPDRARVKIGHPEVKPRMNLGRRGQGTMESGSGPVEDPDYRLLSIFRVVSLSSEVSRVFEDDPCVCGVRPCCWLELFVCVVCWGSFWESDLEESPWNQWEFGGERRLVPPCEAIPKSLVTIV